MKLSARVCRQFAEEAFMVNLQKINGLFDNLQKAVGQLQAINRMARPEFLQNGLILGGARYYLQTAIETCINIGSHIIASEGYRTPKDYRDVFTILNENGILPDDFTVTLRQMAGLRNRLVHLYWEIDDEQIYDILQNDLGDFDRFVQLITSFIEKDME
jgi:uncharacterized protein YutE (UPF0331/DUF86 family)